MRAEAVIGANYGDEGKGLFTDWLCANRPNPIVVMANGGSQRGHTVELKDGKRHVFHHFGAGTFRGASTYFAKTFLLNPMQFVKEHEELKKLGYVPFSCRDPRCIIQLPCDIALNWHIEKSRGDSKHGSVGCGIWETKYRMYNGDSCTLDAFCEMAYDGKVNYIKSQARKYRDLRCAEEGFDNHADIYDLFMSSGFIDHFIADCMTMRQLCKGILIDEMHKSFDDVTLVFENGQGLKLDQFYGAADEANTTPSFTGSIGIAKFLNDDCSKIATSDVTLNYISRTYLTKHGAGKFTEESVFGSDKFSFYDETNVDNEWQDNLRFAKLDVPALIQRCVRDCNMMKQLLMSKTAVKMNLVMTHANEIDVPDSICKCANFDSIFMSTARNSDDIFIND